MKITSKRIKQYNSTTKRVIFADEEPICIVRGKKRESAIISYLSGYSVMLGDLSIKRKLDRFLKDRKEKKPKYIILIIDDNNNILKKIKTLVCIWHYLSHYCAFGIICHIIIK